MNRKLLYCTALLLATACEGGSVRDTMGLTHRAPDEFRVVSRPPLSVPPEFNLRPPAKPGEATDGLTQPAAQQAHALVSGGDSAEITGVSGTAETAVQPVVSADIGKAVAVDPAEAEFLHNAGAPAADDSIREKLNQETSGDRSMLDKIRQPADNQPVVNAEAEKNRLQGDKISGQPPTAGDTPMSQPTDTGTLGRIFGY